METNYWNPTTRQCGTITEIRATGIMNGKMTAYHANYKSKSGPVTNRVCKTFEDADRIMTEHGYKRMAVIDEDIALGLDRALEIVKAASGVLYGYDTDDGISECKHAAEVLKKLLGRKK